MTDAQPVTTQPLPDARHTLPQRLTAEGVGTFLLVTSALLAPAGTTFALVGLTLAVMVIAIGKVSGAQLNPGVTTALIAARQFPLGEGLAYMGAQVVGAVLGMLLGTAMLRTLGHPAGALSPHAGYFVAELLGTATLAFTVVRVVVGGVTDAAAGLAIGLALAISLGLSGAFSGGVLNPAIALSLIFGGLLSAGQGLLYLLAPLLGGALAGLLARFLSSPGELRVPPGRQ
ncbi:aquaporin [Deinococcus sp.]|uniref:aquaporin n=1 Tax=Deinococcus sp. TaxID=47478 RepID=UPI003C79BED7